MKWSEIILERTRDNMSVLRDCVELIINNLPVKLAANKRYHRHGFRCGHAALVKKYTNTPYYGIIKKIFPDLALMITNENKFVNSSTLGSFIPGFIILNAAAFLKSSAPINMADLLAVRRPPPIMSFKALILHELRHLFQFYLHNEYYNFTRTQEVGYRHDPFEIDAAWMHHLEDRPVTDYPDAIAYAHDLMHSFQDYKTLSPQWQQHYFRKTVRHYIDTIGVAARIR